MIITPLKISGSWKFDFKEFKDNRGVFYESFRNDIFKKAIGRSLDIAQTNTSVSERGSVRGIHFASTPPGQAKFVQCLSGSIIDYIVDIRIGSPTFGKFEQIVLKAKIPSAIFIEEGLAHAFLALEDNTVVTYYVSQKYNPRNEHGINPLDKIVNIPWPLSPMNLSEKDKSAPSLVEAQNQNLLPFYNDCKNFIKFLN